MTVVLYAIVLISLLYQQVHAETKSWLQSLLGPHTRFCIIDDDTVLHSKRVDFEYGVLSAEYTDYTCIVIWSSVVARVGLCINEIMGCNDLWCGLGMHKCTDFYVRHKFWTLHSS